VWWGKEKPLSYLFSLQKEGFEAFSPNFADCFKSTLLLWVGYMQPLAQEMILWWVYCMKF
jgi:hypothetical protein